jgi:hypothetical protein
MYVNLPAVTARFLHSKSSRARLRLANAIKFRSLLESHATLRTQTSKSISAFVSIQTTIVGAFCASAHLRICSRCVQRLLIGLVDIGQVKRSRRPYDDQSKNSIVTVQRQKQVTDRHETILYCLPNYTIYSKLQVDDSSRSCSNYDNFVCTSLDPCSLVCTYLDEHPIV